NRYDAAPATMVLQGSELNPALMVLAGWMQILGEPPLELMGEASVRENRLMQGCHQKAFYDFEGGKLESKKTGVMVHYITKQFDRGAVIMAREIEGRQNKGLGQLEDRMRCLDHEVVGKATTLVFEEILSSKA
ncbi:uncharacterized protein BCR38DRAFT_317429, partial [Pseudomassariella vexata]